MPKGAKRKMKAKHQRLTLIGFALAALVAAGLLAAWALRNQASYFYLPEQMRADPPAVGQAVRLGGMVEKGRSRPWPTGSPSCSECAARARRMYPVRFSGIVPDLFEEGSGVVAEGSLQRDGSFRADNLLAKHDENYVPRELEGMSQAQAAKVAEKTTVGLK